MLSFTERGDVTLAESNATKKALASALKSLMSRKPFAKISVGDICSECGMNRKSFYYHFRDKYDLVNWIFYTEFVHTLNYSAEDNGWQHLNDVCRYFHENKRFYSKALKIEGQNSFRDYFHDILEAILLEYLVQYFATEKDSVFAAKFFSDAVICALIRWLTSKEPTTPEEFTESVHRCIKLVKTPLPNEQGI
ncbi:MAG: dihydroxyacetone kinase transcriptional activator DhaS [Ruminococcus sp.]|nr:dihydroxyacetone kinase transcriptional activator DhaS [Ruminococcus sp.]